jgi:hypothetical protein
MNALLKGPSDWLKPAVVNVIPLGTKLNINSVTVEDGVAQVDLSSLALRVPQAKRSLMKSQIAATLEQLADVTNVEISIQRTPQTIDQYLDGQPPSLGSSPVALTDSGLSRLNASGAQAVVGTGSQVNALHPTDFAYSQSQNLVAYVTSTGVRTYKLDLFNDVGRLVDSRPNQLTPGIDPKGSVWTLSSSEGAPFVVTGANRIVLHNNWVSGTPVSFALSPEGARVAIVYLVGKVKVTYVFPIERNKSGDAVSLGKPLQVTAAPINSDHVTWADAVTLAVLAPGSPTGFVPCLVTVGGQLNVATSIDSANSVSVNGTGQLYILQPDGNVVESRGSSWVTLAQKVLALHVSTD